MPVKREQAAKKRAMSAKANMKRVRKKYVRVLLSYQQAEPKLREYSL